MLYNVNSIIHMSILYKVDYFHSSRKLFLGKKMLARQSCLLAYANNRAASKLKCQIFSQKFEKTRAERINIGIIICQVVKKRDSKEMVMLFSVC